MTSTTPAPLYAATVNLAVMVFNPIGSPFPIQAQIDPPVPIPPTPNNIFSGDGDTIVVTLPNGVSGSVQLNYTLSDPKYVLLGIAFAPALGGVGRTEFPSIQIARTIKGSSMSVTDTCQTDFNEINFNYIILVQEVATGSIGVIDPEIESRSGE